MIRLLGSFILGVIVLIAIGFAIGVDRGAEPVVEEPFQMDMAARSKESTTSLPYVPPAVDAQLRRDMSDIAAMMIPIQYVDGGLLSHIPKSLAVPFQMPTSTSPPEVAPLVEPMFRGVNDVHDVAAFGDARFGDDMVGFKPGHFAARPEMDSTVEPFNVVDGMIVTGDGSASSVENNRFD